MNGSVEEGLFPFFMKNGNKFILLWIDCCIHFSSLFFFRSFSFFTWVTFDKLYSSCEHSMFSHISCCDDMSPCRQNIRYIFEGFFSGGNWIELIRNIRRSWCYGDVKIDFLLIIQIFCSFSLNNLMIHTLIIVEASIHILGSVIIFYCRNVLRTLCYCCQHSRRRISIETPLYQNQNGQIDIWNAEWKTIIFGNIWFFQMFCPLGFHSELNEEKSHTRMFMFAFG